MNADLSKKLLIAGASFFVGYSLKQLAKKKWMKVYKEEPPANQPSEEINWRKVLLWSVITGTVISSAQLATARYLAVKLDS